MDRLQLNLLSQKIKIASEHILREYFEMAILQIFSDTNLTKDMIFYGGTALRLAYNGIRFSEDLDFLIINEIKVNKLKEILSELTKKYMELSLVEIKDKRNTLFALLKIQHSSLKYPRHIKIEICKKKNGIKSEYRLISSQCSNLTPLIQTATLESLECAKIKAINGRNEPRDFFDFWLIENLLKKPVVFPKTIPFEHNEFKRELKRFIPQNKWLIIDQILKC